MLIRQRLWRVLNSRLALCAAYGLSVYRKTVIASGVEVNEVDNINEFSDLMKPFWDRKSALPEQRRLIEDIVNMRGAR